MALEKTLNEIFEDSSLIRTYIELVGYCLDKNFLDKDKIDIYIKENTYIKQAVNKIKSESVRCLYISSNDFLQAQPFYQNIIVNIIKKGVERQTKTEFTNILMDIGKLR